MGQPRVLNARIVDRHGPNKVFIGRPTKWGNPYVIGKDGTREEVVRLYAERLALLPDLQEAAKKELAGKDLVCYCAPKACHGDILLKIANEG